MVCAIEKANKQEFVKVSSAKHSCYTVYLQKFPAIMWRMFVLYCENDMDLTYCNIVTHVLFLTVSISR